MRFSIFLTLVLLTAPIAVYPESAPVPPAPESGSGLAIEIPKELGTLQLGRKGNSGKTVVFIQDAHDSYEAQTHIAEIIRLLAAKYGIRHVWEEGASGPVATDEYFGFIQDADMKRKVSDFFMDRLRVGGAEFAHINRAVPFELTGADDSILHLENISAYHEVSQARSGVGDALAQILSALETLANRYFPAGAKTWLKHADHFNADRKQLAAYIGYLKRVAEKNPGFVTREEFPMLHWIWSAGKNGTAQAPRPSPSRFASELEKLEARLVERLLPKERDRQIYEFLHFFKLLKRLNALELSPGEYREAKEAFRSFDFKRFYQFMSEHLPKPVVFSKTWQARIQNAFLFYELAMKRDLAVREAMEAFRSAPDASAAVLVFGGFHRDRIEEILKEFDLTYYIVTPRISKISAKHQNYYRTLMSKGYYPFEVPAAVSSGARAQALVTMPGGRAEVRFIYDLFRRFDGDTLRVERHLEREQRTRPEMRSEAVPGHFFTINPLDLPLFLSVVGEDAMKHLGALVNEFKLRLPASFENPDDAWVLHVNSSVAGGVGDILVGLLSVAEDPLVALNSRWFLMEGNQDFFKFTAQGIHEVFHGAGVPATDEDRERFNEVGAWNVKLLLREMGRHHLRPPAVVVIHDQQPLGMLPALKELWPDTKFIWRGHIPYNIDPNPDSLSYKMWAWLSGNFITLADALVFHLKEYQPGFGVREEQMVRTILPSINPVALYNRSFTVSLIEATLQKYGIEHPNLEGPGMRPFVIQNGRFDPFKGQMTAILAYERAVKELIDRRVPLSELPRLMLFGPFAADNESALPIYRSLIQYVEDTQLEQRLRGRIREVYGEEAALVQNIIIQPLDPANTEFTKEQESNLTDLKHAIWRERKRLEIPTTETPDEINLRQELTSDVRHQVETSVLLDAARVTGGIALMMSSMEGFGVAATSNGFHEIARIASRVGGIPHQIIDGETGYLVGTNAEGEYNAGIAVHETAERIVFLMTHPEERKRIAENGRADVIKRFLLDRHLGDWVSLFRDVFSSGVQEAAAAGARAEFRRQAVEQFEVPNLDSITMLDSDVVFVIEASTVDELDADVWAELMTLLYFNREHLHLVVPDLAQAGLQERVEALRSLAPVNRTLTDVMVSKRMPVIFFSNAENETPVAARLDERTASQIREYFALFPGTFGTALLWAVNNGDLPGPDLNRVNGYLYDDDGWYGTNVMEQLLASYEVISRAA